MEETLRWAAAAFTIVPGIVIAARARPLFVGWAFVGLTVGALLWILIGYLTRNYAILAQNVAIGIINTLGIYRWLIWQGKFDAPPGGAR